MRRLALLAVLAVAGAASAPAAASAADPDPDEFTPPGFEFCGWEDIANGGWAMEWRDELQGAYRVAFADGMSCRAARKNVKRIRFSKTPPYKPYRPGYRCRTVRSEYEFSDVVCRKKGTRKRFRYHTGA